MVKNNNKKKKKNLSSLVLLLLFTVIMLGTSTYAWFTANKNVSIEGIDVDVETSSGLQISVDGSVWKTKITNTDITGASWTNNRNQMPAVITPVSTAATVDASEAGCLDFYDGEVADNGSGNLALTTTKAATETKTTSTGNYIAFDMFLKTESAAPIYLTTSAGVVSSEVEDKGLKNASRIAFVIEGTVDTGASNAAASAQALNNASTIVVWEPNYDAHTSYGVAQANDYYNISTLSAGVGNSAVAYDGVKGEVTSVLLASTNATADSTNFGSVTTVKTLATPTAYTQIFNLSAGITKIRVYYWVEGQDVDCENNASGSGIALTIALSLNSAPGTGSGGSSAAASSSGA